MLIDVTVHDSLSYSHALDSQRWTVLWYKLSVNATRMLRDYASVSAPPQHEPRLRPPDYTVPWISS